MTGIPSAIGGIVVRSDGGIAELGDHQELLAHNGIYAELYQVQASAYA